MDFTNFKTSQTTDADVVNINYINFKDPDFQSF